MEKNATALHGLSEYLYGTLTPKGRGLISLTASVMGLVPCMAAMWDCRRDPEVQAAQVKRKQ